MPPLKSWVKYDPETTDFPLENLPYGVFSSPQDATPRIGVAIGDLILDLKKSTKIFTGPYLSKQLDVFQQTTLNAFMSLTSEYWKEARKCLQGFLSLQNEKNKDHAVFTKQAEAKMHLPCVVGDYTDFFSSYHHAWNCSQMLKSSLMDTNWRYMPKAYHGRSSSVVVSGTGVRRPGGQIYPCPARKKPALQVTNRLDFEVEVGVFVGGSVNKLGECLKMEDADELIFGMVLLNDWSARDIQALEMNPLGPFASKNFATTISPWIVTMEALMPFKVPNSKQIPTPLKYLRHAPNDNYNFDIKLLAYMKATERNQEDNATASMEITWNEKEYTKVTETNYKYLYWTAKQHLIQHSINGCNLRAGDLMGTGTISGPEKLANGCLFEITDNGTNALTLSDGKTRSYLSDGDVVIIKGQCIGDGYRIGFGECTGQILDAELIIEQESDEEDEPPTPETPSDVPPMQ